MPLDIAQLDRRYMPGKGILSWTEGHKTFLRQLYADAKATAQAIPDAKARRKRSLIKRQEEINACIMRLEIAKRVVETVNKQTGVKKLLPTWDKLEDHVVSAENGLPEKEMDFAEAFQAVIAAAVKSVVGKTGN